MVVDAEPSGLDLLATTPRLPLRLICCWFCLSSLLAGVVRIDSFIAQISSNFSPAPGTVLWITGIYVSKLISMVSVDDYYYYGPYMSPPWLTNSSEFERLSRLRRYATAWVIGLPPVYTWLWSRFSFFWILAAAKTDRYVPLALYTFER